MKSQSSVEKLSESLAGITIVESNSSSSSITGEVLEISSFEDDNSIDYPFPVIIDTPQTQVLELDTKTKDNHVPRDERLLRLTGAHPFNCEAPLTLLYEQGFLTPADLHFVRNHGPVPQVLDDEILNWEFSVEGMVDEPFTMTVAQLMSEFEQWTTPITLVCAGNRRKEQNQVKKGKGFNWGAAGISTSLWTGPTLRDVINRAKPHKRARFVWMEGADDPANGAYGTCVPMHMVQDPERQISVVYKQNGQFLSPDHGKPLRVIIPGVIGGRSVKWLKKLVVAETPSRNWYHFYDNKVLPTMVTPEMAKEDDSWWKDERYTIYDLNPQSIICYPEMEEVMQVDITRPEESYTIKGYAYNGGGVAIGRVEISLDRGKSWTLAEIDYPEDQYRDAGYVELFGGVVNVCDRVSHLCWCFWELKVLKTDLLKAKDIVVRCMDARMVAQPRNMYWNVTSMLNNWWYRVAIQHTENSDEIKFEHPCNATKPGGWMDRVKSQGGDILSNTWGEDDEEEGVKKPKGPLVDKDLEMIVNPEKADVIITKEELAKHENEEEPWFVVKGHVFDGTPFLNEHPGGIQSITMVAGEDATDDFIAIHSESSKRMLAKFHLGRLEGTAENNNSQGQVEPPKEATPTLLNPKIWKKVKMVERESISHDSRIYHFELEHPEQTTGLPTGKHLFLRLKDNESGSLVMRAYTPKSCHRTKGKLQVLIKTYFPNGDIPGGKMTMLLEKLALNDTIEVKGPLGEFEYLGSGEALFNHKPFKVESYFMVAGGSGITPCFQIIQEIMYQKDDQTKINMFYGNRTTEDILLHKELDEYIATDDRGLLRVDHCLSDYKNLPSDWNGLTGRLTRALWDKYIEEHTKLGNYMVLVCGPPGMVNSVKTFVEESNIDVNRVVYF